MSKVRRQALYFLISYSLFLISYFSVPYFSVPYFSVPLFFHYSVSLYKHSGYGAGI